MKTILKMQIKLVQSKYGVSMYFIPLFQLGKSIFNFVALVVCGVIAWQFTDHVYFTQSIYEQLIIVICFLCILLFKNENQYALVPYITKISVYKITNYILVRELFSAFNFFLIPLIIPVLYLSNTIEKSTLTYVFLFISLWLVGLLLNLFTRIIKFFCIKYRFFFIITLGITLTYSIILVLFFRTTTVFSYSIFFDNIYYITALLAGISLLISGFFYVIKQELYKIYEGNHVDYETIRIFNPKQISSNKILLLEYLRCKEFRKFLTSMCLYLFVGIIFYIKFDFMKPLGLGIFLGTYTLSMLQFTIYISSNYFDGLYTKQVSIKSLLLSSFYIHIIATSFLFLILLIFIILFDKHFILPLIALYLYMSGPMALFLLHNVLFAKKYDLYPIQSDTKIQRTFAQQVIGIISGISLFGCAAIIHFSPTIGCYVILAISLITIMTYSRWIDFLSQQFLKRKYLIMENLRIK